MKDHDIVKRDEERMENVEQKPTVAPPVDIYENADEILLVADLPGIESTGLSIDVDKDHLTLLGRRKTRTDQPVAAEYREVDFRRTFRLPYGLDAANAAADLKHGVLTIKVPKSAAMNPRKISVTAG
jgi:HSP20 family molecular chaperone IbpA